MNQSLVTSSSEHAQLSRAVYLAICLALLVPPFIGGSIMGVIGFFPVPEFYWIFSSYSGAYVAVVLFFCLLFGRYAIGWIEGLVRLEPARRDLVARRWLGRFPWLLLCFVTVYSLGGALSADLSLVSLGVWQYDWPRFRLTLMGIVPAVLITALPVFFGFSDFLGRWLAPRGVQVVAIPLWIKLLMLGFMTPLLIDSMLIGYFYNRTGFFEAETLLLWFALLVLAAVGTYLAWVSLRQGMRPFERVLDASGATGQAEQIQPQSLDEMGYLAARWAELLKHEKQLMQAAHESEQRASVIFEQAASGIALVSLEGKLLQMNPRMQQMLGYSEAELRQHSFRDVTDPLDVGADQAMMDALRQGKQGSYSLEKRYITKDGRRLWGNLTVSLARDEEGKPAYFIKVVEDIGQRKAHEAEVSRLMSIFDSAPDFISMADTQGRLMYLNAGGRAILGFGADEDIAAYRIADAHPASEAERIINEVLPVCNKNGHWEGETVFRRRDGSTFVGAQSVMAHFDESGKVIYYSTVTHDISERIRADEAIRRERNFVNAVLDNAAALILVLDSEGRIHRFNRSCEKLSGYSFAEAEGRFVWDFLLPPEEAEAVHREAFLALANNPQQLQGGFTNHWVSRSGEKRLIEWSNSVLLNDSGTLEFMVAIGMDVTAQRETQVALERSEETYAQAEAITHIGSWDWNILTNDLHWTDEIYRIFGLTPQSFGATYPAFLEAVHPDDRQSLIDAVGASVADANLPYSIEHRVVRPDGSQRIVHERGKVYRDEQGKPVRMIGTVHDITENKVAEEALRASEKKYRELHESVRDGFVRVDMVGHILEFNQAYQNMLGYGTEELYSRTYVDLTPEKWHGMEADIVQNQVLPRGYSDIYKKEYRHKDGHLFPIELRTYLVRDEAGEPCSMWAIVRDISERERLYGELRQHREHLQEMVEERSGMLQEAQRIAHLGNWKWDVASGRITWSDEIFRIFGYRPGEFEPTYERFLATVHPDDLARIKQSEQEAFAKGHYHSIDHRIVLPTGEIRWVHEEAEAHIGPDGQPISLTGTVQDITLRKQTEDALVKAKELAERASKGKSEFLSRMSHELRTPMNAILGFAQVLETEPLSPEQQDFVKEIHVAGQHLLELINELLDLSRIEAGRFSLVIKPENLARVSQQAIQLVTPLLRQKEISLINRCDKDFLVLADATRLKQVLVNLLSNAAKYNRQHGSIYIDSELGQESMRIKITDTGIGIAEQKQGQLFMPFERLGAEFTAVDGTGIGLALSKHMVELMGGRIGVESKPGQGSTFWFDIPLAGQDDMPQRSELPAQSLPAATLKLLYVEDNAANLKVVEAMLRRHPEMVLLSATDGEYGLELARSYLPDVILLDIHLTGMDGYAVLAALQSHEDTRHIPVVALSADAMPLDIEKGLSAGFKRYLTKPVKVKELLETIQSLVN